MITDTALQKWTTRDIPPQTGRLAIVTGSTGGLGFQTALALARAGATTILAARNPIKGDQALAAIRASVPNANVSFELLDLASLDSISAFAARLSSRNVDILVNNAAVMALLTRQTTADGFEMQFGTNYLGHFALTAHLLPLLQRSSAPRVIQLSSLAHEHAKLRFDDLQLARKYHPWIAYSQSKLAMLMFSLELQRRSAQNAWGITSLAAHPGLSQTDIIHNGFGRNSLLANIGSFLFSFFSQSAADGALPILYAATAPEAASTPYYGPAGFHEMKGPVAIARMAKQARDLAAASRLWEISTELTRAPWPATLR